MRYLTSNSKKIRIDRKNIFGAPAPISLIPKTNITKIADTGLIKSADTGPNQKFLDKKHCTMFHRLIENNKIFSGLTVKSGRQIDLFLDGTINKPLSPINIEINQLEKSQVNIYWFSKTSVNLNVSLNINLLGKNSQVIINGISIINHNAEIKFKVNSNHLAPLTTSNIYLKSLGHDRSSGIITGRVYISKKAKQSKAFLAQAALLLSPNSRIESEPKLEILNNDVQASHSATIGYLSANQLYYLMSRGLTLKKAIELLQRGFLGSLIQKIDNPYIKNHYLKLLGWQKQ